MSVTVDILDGIQAEALAFQQARVRYERAFREFLVGLPPLSPEHFWPMADAFRLVVLRTMLHRQERIAELAADEFLRLAVIGDAPWSVSGAVHFCLSYQHYSQLAYAGGNRCRFGFDRGDDAYSDLMDAVVLLGQSFNERLHAGRFYDLAEFKATVSDLCHASVTEAEFPFQYADDPAGSRMSLASRLRTMVMQGENYFAMYLEEEAAERVASEAIKAAT